MLKKYLSILLLFSIICFCKGIFFVFSHSIEHHDFSGNMVAINDDMQDAKKGSCCMQNAGDSNEILPKHHKLVAHISQHVLTLPIASLFLFFAYSFVLIALQNKNAYPAQRPPPLYWLKEQFSQGILHPKTW